MRSGWPGWFRNRAAPRWRRTGPARTNGPASIDVGMTGFLALFVGLLTSGMPVFLVLGLCAGAMFVASGQPLVGAAQLVINELNSPSLMALPLFVMAAAFMRFGGIA